MNNKQRAALAAILGISGVSACSLQAQNNSNNLINAAQRKYGARLEAAARPGARLDPNTQPGDAFDGNLHSRMVASGAPYSYTIELIEKLPVEKIGFANSDYLTEMAPKEIEITLDDGTVIKQTLEVKRPEKRKAVWQEVPIGKSVQTIKIAVLSNHPGAEKINWGGLGEIAVWTNVNLDAKMAIPDYDPKAPAFVRIPPIQTAQNIAPVKLPPVAAPGEHPRLLLTKSEVTTLRADLQKSERGKAALQTLLNVADGVLNGEINFPDPKGPLGQLKDRGDDVAKRHDRISLNAGTLGMAYTLTGDAKYARRAAEILKGYAALYESYPEHKGANKNDTGKVMGQRLSEAMWLIPLIESFDYIYDSGALSDVDKKQIETGLIRPAITFIRRKDPAAEVAEREAKSKNWRTEPTGKAASNWLLFYNAATMMAGGVLDDQNMRDLAASDFRMLILNGIGSDGMWGEGAIGYQFFAISALMGGLESAARQGIDLWSFADNRVKMLFDSPLRYAYPDGSAPGINDSGRTRFGDWSTMSYDYGYLRYGEPAYAFLLNASPRQLQMSQAVYFPTRVYETVPEPPATRFPSTVFENLGYAILRDDKSYALLDYGPHGGTHGHYDKLNLILFGGAAAGQRGDELGGEPQFHRYEDPLHGQWTVETVAHNSMAVDGASQLPGEGKLLVFEDAPEIKIMRGESATSYPGVLLDRTVVVTPEMTIDLYHGRSATRHTWTRTFRYQGAMTNFPVVANPPGEVAKPLGTRDGFQHVNVLQRKDAAQSWNGTWQTKVGNLEVLVAGAPNQQMLLASGPDQEQMALAQQQGNSADFAAIYRLNTWPNAPQSIQWLPADNGVRACEIKAQDGTTTRLFVAQKAGAWKAAGWDSDARVLYVKERNGKRTVQLCGGTFANNGATQIKLDAPGSALKTE